MKAKSLTVTGNGVGCDQGSYADKNRPCPLEVLCVVHACLVFEI